MRSASWANVIIGLWLVISPWTFGHRMGSATSEDVIVGLIVVAVALWSLSVPAEMTAPAWINLVLGIWVLIAPWAIGYAGLASASATNDVIMGMLIILFAGIRIVTPRQTTPVGPSPRY